MINDPGAWYLPRIQRLATAVATAKTAHADVLQP